jgi:hypothetical protein
VTFPEPSPGPSRERLLWRTGTAVVLLALSLLVFREPAAATLALATASGVASGRSFGLLVVLGGAALVGPVAVGTLLGDYLYDRFGGDGRA